MSGEELKAKIIVMDTGPLITLAVADSLDYLFYPDVPLYIPDAVYYEATMKAGALGASEIETWVHANIDRIHLIPTTAYKAYRLAAEADPTIRMPNLGESAALEAIRYAVHLAPDERAVLLTEDDRLIRGGFIVVAEDRDRIISITTLDFLTLLEQEQLINSADEVYRTVEDAGRAASRRRALQDQHKAAVAAVERVMQRRPKDAKPSS